MIPLDVKLYAAQEKLTWPELKEHLSKQIKEGTFYARFNPEELGKDDIFPVFPVNIEEPFPAGALELVPFPLLLSQYNSLSEKDADAFYIGLASIKASYCLAGRQANSKDLLFAAEQIRQFYACNVVRQYEKVCWIDLDPARAPYQPLVENTFVTLERRRIQPQSQAVILPIFEAQGEVLTDSWETPEPDKYGFRFILLAKKEARETLVAAAILEQSEKNEVWFSLYRLTPKLYIRTKKHLFTLLGSRLQEKSADLPRKSTGRFRGRIYRK